MSDDYGPSRLQPCGAKYVPAHPDNIHAGVNKPKVLVWHTPEEPVDATETTPELFSRKIFGEDGMQRLASTSYYISGGAGTFGDGDLYQCVREHECAIANGVTTRGFLDAAGLSNLNAKTYPAGTDPAISLNCQSLSVELEGFAREIHKTMVRGGEQWRAAVEWCESRAWKYDIPLTLERAGVSHAQLSVWRTDPGKLDRAQIIRDAIALRLTERFDGALEELEDGMAAGFVKLAPGEADPGDPNRVWLVGLHSKRKMFGERSDLANALGIPNNVKIIKKRTLDRLYQVTPVK